MANMRAVPASGASTLSTAGGFVPPPITQVEDTGLSMLWLQDLALKILYFQGLPHRIQGVGRDGAALQRCDRSHHGITQKRKIR